MQTAIEIKNLTVYLNHTYMALEDISIDIPIGAITGFVGPSGAGKTTLIRSIVGRQKLKSGSIKVFSIPAGDKKLRSNIGYMTQELSIYPDLTVYENIKYFAVMHGLSPVKSKEEARNLIELLDLKDQSKNLCSNLSGGQKQRVSLATSLVGKPKILALDEPTVGLDPVLRQSIWNLFRELADQGSTILISSHVMDEAERCDNLIMLRNGNVIGSGTPKEIKTSTNCNDLEAAFLKMVGNQ